MTACFRHTPSGDHGYLYDYADSNLISMITLPDSKRYEYVYDDLYRLTNEYALNSDSTPIYTNGYEYDLADNRTGAANGTADIYVLNALNQITEIYEIYQPPHTTFAYNFNGNLTEQTTSAGTVAMEYDYENRLVKLTYPVGGWTEFTYDSLGRRLKTVEKNGQGQITGETRYVYDGLNVIAELTGTDTLAAFFTQGIGVDDPLIMRYSGADYFYQKNHQNSVIEVDNMSGGVVKKYKYDAFGNIKQETGPTVNRGFTYTSRERHSRSGLYYYRARWYSPTLGRFLTPDPLGHLGGVNLYAYVGNDPINLIDPLGLQGSIFGPFSSPSLGNELRQSLETSADYYQGMYERAHEIRSEAQREFRNDDFQRHYTASYTFAQEYGTGNARLAGIVNEIQGLILYDIGQLLFYQSMYENRPWAFSLTDLYVNELAFEAAMRNRCNAKR